MFFLVPRIALILFVCFGLALAGRALRQRRWRLRRGRRGRDPFSQLPLVPAEVLRGAERTWVVFTTPDCDRCRAIAERLRTSEPASQVTEIDTRREPLLAEAFHVREVPAVLLANRYGQVEARLIGRSAIESALPSAG
ncbi:MAG: Thioredoxin [Acidimicrobiaceae bacterium]|jgi:hypothetical protein|nr:Thioredoxin [Acidimicrobiaceae bacterium]